MRAVFILALALFIQPSIAQDFCGYPCTVDCSGHEAGYDWAEKKDIDSTFDCNGNSNSFNEGCEAYVEEQEHKQKEEEVRRAEDEGLPAEE